MRRLATFIAAFVLTLVPTYAAVAETFESPQGNFNWKVYDYNPSDQALRVRQPFFVNEPDGGIAFNFLYEPDTALFMTGHPSYRGDLLGDMRGKDVTARIGITVTSGAPVYTYYGEGTPDNPCGEPANVRFYFQTRTNGPFNPSDYWWSNPVHSLLQPLNDNTVEITNSFEPGLWTNYFGQPDPVGFEIAASNVVAIGLSFGGGCFFENGVGIVPGTGSAYFRLMDYSATPPGLVNPLAQVVPELVLAPFTTPTLIWLP
jgi:hypothetical protein